MRKTVAIGTGLLAGILLAATPATAHHSHSMYAYGETVSLQGVVRKVRWANPHVHFELEVRGTNGEIAVWVIESEPPALMSKFGWTRDSMSVGDTVTFTGTPARNPARTMAQGSSAVTASGKHLWISGATPYDEQAKDLAVPFHADSLSGTWSTQFNPQAVVGYIHRESGDELTAKGNAALETVSDIIPAGTECIPNPVPYTMLVPITSKIEIGDSVTRLLFEGDQGLVERSVNMRADSYAGATPANQGHSIGWWDEETLVVDTTHFAVHANGHGRGIPSSPAKHLVERFELTPDRTSIRYTFRVEDPEYLAEPASATLKLLYRPDLEILDVPCKLESAREYLDQ